MPVDDRLTSLASRIVRLEEERDQCSEGIKDIYTEAKSAGYDLKALRLTIKRLKESGEERQERERVDQEVQLYIASIGPLSDTPLGHAAIQKLRAVG